MSNTPSKAEIEALVKRHGATSYRNRADTQHPAYGFTEDGLNGLIDEVLEKWGTPPAVAGEPYGYVYTVQVAHLWQHCETGRTRIVMPDMIVDADASWQVVGPLCLGAAPPTAQAEGWTKLPGQLPEPGMPVLLDIGKKYPIRAMWAAKHTVQAADDDTDWGEYVEADDMYYAPEGWYEWNQCEDNHWRVTETPRAWMPLPPTSAEGVEHGPQ